MFGESSDASPRRFGSYEVAGTIAEPRSSDGSTVYIAISRPPKTDRDTSGKLALSFSPSNPNEPTKTVSRPVIIKQLSPSLTADKAKLEAFLQAARSATTLRNNNVAEVESVGTDGDDVYLVLDYLLGETVASLLRRLQAEGDRLKPPLAAYIAAEVCKALDAGHSQGIVHARLTPHDIFIGYDGSVHLLDIGIADARVKLAGGRISGTELEYASPEVCRNEPIDARADIFTMGVMLWELLSGLSPFERPKDEDVVRAICDETVVPPKNIVPGLPTELSVITLQALHRDRGIRFQSAKAMHAALESMVKKYIVGKPADHLSKVMKKLFSTRELDKRAMVKRVMAGESIDGLDIKASDRSNAPARKMPIPGQTMSSSKMPAVKVGEKPYAEGDDPSTNILTMQPARSNPPPSLEEDPPSIVVVPPMDPAPPVGTIIATLPSGELRLDENAPPMLPSTPVYLTSPPPAHEDAAPPVVDEAVILRPQKRVSGGVLVAVIGAILAFTVVIVVVVTRKSGPDPRAAKPPPSSAPTMSVAARDIIPPPPPVSAPDPAPAPAPDPTPVTTTTTTTSADNGETTLHIETIPAQAAIFIAGTKKGMSPADIRVAKSSDPIVLEIRHNGYSTLREQVVPDQNQRLKLTLLAKGVGGGKPPPKDTAAPVASTNPYKKFE